jgi:hypothetical protein
MNSIKEFEIVDTKKNDLKEIWRMLERDTKQNIGDSKNFPDQNEEKNSDTKKMKCECKFIKILNGNISRESGNNDKINKLKSFSLRGSLNNETSGLIEKIDGIDFNKNFKNQFNQMNKIDNPTPNFMFKNGQINNKNQNSVDKLKELNFYPNIGDDYRMKEIVDDNYLKNNNIISEVKDTYSNLHANSMKDANLPFNNKINKNKIQALNTDSQPLDSNFFTKSKFFKTNESNENSEKLDYKNILNYLHKNTLLMKNLENLILKNTETSSLQLSKYNQNFEIVNENKKVRFQIPEDDINSVAITQSLPKLHSFKRDEISKINSDKIEENRGVSNSNINNRQNPPKQFDYYADAPIGRNKENLNQFENINAQLHQQNTKQSHSVSSSFDADSSLSNDLMQIVKNMDLKVNPSENNQFFQIDFSKYKELLK